MAKTASKTTKAAKIVAMINAGATWTEVAEAFKHSERYVQVLAKSKYKTDTGYNKLLAKAKANKKAKAKANELIQPEKNVVEEVSEVIVTETGYLLCTGMSGLTSESLDIYIPYFCVRELEKLSRASSVAEDILTMYYASRRMTSVNLRGKEVLFEEPKIPVKDRSKGVVALCCYLWGMGYRVRLLTSSREILELAEMQGIDISIVKVSS